MGIVAPETIIPIRLSGSKKHTGKCRASAPPELSPSPAGVLLHPRVSELMGRKTSRQSNALRKPNVVPRNFGLSAVHNVRLSVWWWWSWSCKHATLIYRHIVVCRREKTSLQLFL